MSQFKGRLAQRLEQGTHNPLVEGSNPPAPTNLPMTNNNTNHRDVNQVPKNFVYNLRRSGIKPISAQDWDILVSMVVIDK